MSRQEGSGSMPWNISKSTKILITTKSSPDTFVKTTAGEFLKEATYIKAIDGKGFLKDTRACLC